MTSDPTPQDPLLHLLDAGLAQARQGLEALCADAAARQAIAAAIGLLVQTLRLGGRVIACGNGGSMCEAMHFADELTGRYRQDRPALPATAIADPGHLTGVGNDFGFDQVFARHVQAHGRPGDCLVALSTSGRSANVIEAARTARALGMSVIGLTGLGGLSGLSSPSGQASPSDQPQATLGPLCTVHLCTPAGRWADRVQELHLLVLHLLVEGVERQLFGASAAPLPPAATPGAATP